ncbi:MAG: ribonuclease HII [Acidimicrobiales bacterium]
MSPTPDDLMTFERALIERGEVVVGVDEVGRGALAGPLMVGAVVLGGLRAVPRGLKDSKALTPGQRQDLVVPIREWADDWSIGEASAEEIDAWGLRVALAVAATRALDRLRTRPTFALLDGPFNLLSAPAASATAPALPELRYRALPFEPVVKGDSRCATIAAASVIAKVARDAVMVDLDEGFPAYGWAANKGYGSLAHRRALERVGPCSLHRRTWALPRRAT